MARGWESKSVEDQIASAEERKTQRKPALTANERERQSRKTGLLLARTKVLSDIENARDDRHRALLQRSLEYIDGQIEAL
jgi:hypothetical protein